jgi:hypothetical protein
LYEKIVVFFLAKEPKCMVATIYQPTGFMAHLVIEITACQVPIFRMIRKKDDCHLGIRPSGNPPPQKAPPLYEGVDLIPEIFKIYTYV